MSMPIFNLNSLTANCNEYEAGIVRGAFTDRGVQGKENGFARLREAKPFKTVKTIEQGLTNYVWRMLCFDLVGSGKHACMPVCADFDIYEALVLRDGKRPSYNYTEGADNSECKAWDTEKRNLMKSMDELVKRVEKDIPFEQQKGIVRWGRALGMLG